MKEYRVIWQREGSTKKRKVFQSKTGANRWFRLLTDKEPPWNLYNIADPDEVDCCDGNECGCGGVTFREIFAKKSEGLAKIIHSEIQSREVGEWGKPEQGGGR